MNHRYLEVTFRNGKPLAAYLYLPRKAADASARTVRYSEGLLVDFAADGRAIGIEILSPRRVSLAVLNAALAFANQDPATPDELAPVAAA